MAQIRLAEEVAGNTRRILACIEEAAGQGVEILGFPETALTGYRFDAFAQVDFQEVEAALEEISGRLRGGRLHVILGTPTREKGAVYNSAVLLSPDGGRSSYHKIHLVDYETAWFARGSRRVTFEVNAQRFGIMICRDQNSPELARELKDLGARGLFIASAHYYELLESRMKREKNWALPIARAYENGLYVFKANAVGTLARCVSYGGSLIVDSRGIVIQRGGESEEGLLIHDLDVSRDNPRW